MKIIIGRYSRCVFLRFMKFFLMIVFVFSGCSSFSGTGTLKWDNISDSRMMSWAAAKRYCEENGKRLPSPAEVLSEWKSFESSNYIWTAGEKDSSSAYYMNLRLGAVNEDFKSSQYSAVCVCISGQCREKTRPESVQKDIEPEEKLAVLNQPIVTEELVWEFHSEKRKTDWITGNMQCRAGNKRLPSREEVLKYWKEIRTDLKIWTSEEKKDSPDSVKEAYYINLKNGKIDSMTKTVSTWSAAVCVCPASECSPAALKKKEELYWEPVKFVKAAGGLKLREGPSAKTKPYCTVPEGSVLKISEKTDKKEIIDGTEDVWVKADFCGRSGYLFGGYLCSVKADGCNDFNDFISAFKSVCTKGRCFSVKQYEQGDEGRMWKESSVFYEPGKEFYLGIKYNALGGTIVSVKKIRNTYYILYHESGNSEPQDRLRHIRVRIDPAGKKLFTHDPQKDYSLKLNDFSNQLIEYR